MIQTNLTAIDVDTLRRRLTRARIASVAAIELGDYKAVARLTCETSRLRQAISLAGAILLDTA